MSLLIFCNIFVYVKSMGETKEKASGAAEVDIICPKSSMYGIY